ncbi:YhcB family protein [Reinekea marinisedimentorum]|uniref:Z-ring associated protein G n=1 Tax=Reinekea marinisedimentorum TaxID=230495 RepID=A0A4R3HWH4_9GAMM|nr:DUF1043 family protein [Reinekea marinisedimentorum]TCS37637.1 hypothetical protein BCF53_11959 [Reinekea marinisedimentorum]
MLQLSWLSFSASIVVALIIGGLLTQLILKTGGKDRMSLKRDLNELKKEHQTYQINVTEHFSRTTELISELSESYKQIQDHLTRGAEEFVKPEYRLTSSANEPSLEDLAPADETDAKPSRPLDYVAKGPEEEGTLSENYGFKKPEDSTATKKAVNK